MPIVDWEKIFNLGGLALFAFVCLKQVIEIGKLRAEDLKESLNREKENSECLKEVHRSMLTTCTNMATALVDLRVTLTSKLDDTWNGPRRRASDKTS